MTDPQHGRQRRRATAFTRRGIVLAFVVAMAWPGAFQSALATGTQPLAPISSDPYTNPTSQHATEVEPHVLAEAGTIVAAFQVGRFANGGSSDIGWSRSTNDGVSWTPGYLPGLTTFESGGTYASASDPTVAYDKAHDVWMITSLGLYPGPTPGTFANEGDVVTSRSIDGGASWQTPVMIGGNGVQALDKPWVICDNTASSPYYGHCYATYDDFGNHDQVSMSTSTNGGLTWSTPIATVDAQRGLGGVPVVQSNGRVIVPLLGPAYIDTFSSTDGGATWKGTTHISKVHFFNPSIPAENYLRVDPLPSAAIDSHDRIFVVWSDCRFARNCRRNDAVMSTSDNGTKWTPVQRIPLDGPSARESFAEPSIATDPSTAGKHTALALTTYTIPHPSCSESACQLRIDFASSRDRGKMWTRAGQIEAPMNITWAPATTGGYMFGDYFAVTVSSDGMAIPVQSVAHQPGAGFDQAINSGRFAIEAGTFRTEAPRSTPAATSGVSSPIVPPGSDVRR